ncbi:MAG: ABC transporter permease subunit [Verrucomicrobia bacterium]|jgi:ABC-2 type transport system permease protein|nr:ABC transporter permease subunit [Verrucomicrobiota bacterium]
MRTYWILLRRELGAYFVFLSGYVVIAAAAFLMGLGFLNMVIAVRGETMLVPVTELFYQTPYFWMIVLLTSPIITMRLFALEKYAGTFETLMTTPVRDTAVVLAKFSAALVFFLVLWLPLAGCFFILRQMTGQGLPMDWGAVAATGLGILLLGCLFCSIGCFASSLTRTQTVAAMLGLALGVGLFLVGMLAGRPPAGLAAWQAAALAPFALLDHLQDFARGVVDTRPIVFFLSLSALFLYLTLRVVESRHWK